MEQAEPRTIDVTGLSPEAVAAVESLVSLLRRPQPDQWLPPGISSREEWAKAIHAFAASHEPIQGDVGESINAGRGETGSGRFATAAERIQAIRAWAESRPYAGTSADWSRESIYGPDE